MIKRIVNTFLDGHLAVLLGVTALLLGIASVIFTPREEEPQIVVPVADVFVEAPGASAEEVEKLITAPLERALWQIDGVEYVYSISQRDRAVVTVRFFVGEDREDSLIKIYNGVTAQMKEAPALVHGWGIKPVEIDDVPIVTMALYSDTYDDFELRRVGDEVRAHLDMVKDVSKTRVVGGRTAEVRVTPNPEALAAYNITLLQLYNSIGRADASISAGDLVRGGKETAVVAGPFLTEVEDVSGLVVGVFKQTPVYLRDVAAVSLGPEEFTKYTRIGFGPADAEHLAGSSFPSITLAVSKKKGTNAVAVAANVRERMEELKRTVIPDGMHVRITRDNGQSADGKVDELLSSLVFAMISVVALLMFFLGWREGLIVALAVPVSFSLALFTNMLLGYTINRVTLFALILTLGLVVDDPITNVDNIQRHILKKLRSGRDATLDAVSEVLPPVIMSTLTVIVSFLPLFFITGMMGPYMEPMAGTVPLTVIFSTVAALSLVPWATYKLLRNKGLDGGNKPEPVKVTAGKKTKEPIFHRLYRGAMTGFLQSRIKRWALLVGILVLLGASGMLAVTGRVPMKILPFDNKDELLLVVDMPEGTALENTDAVMHALEAELATVPEIVDYTTFTGTYGPIDFNGLVRHYFFRSASNVGDIRINLAKKEMRGMQSHEIGLRIRDRLTEIANAHGAVLNLVESPPGPPVLASVVVEVYGGPGAQYDELIRAASVVRKRMSQEQGLVDLDDTIDAEREHWEFLLDREKASLHGIDNARVTATLRLALGGDAAASLHSNYERESLPIRVQLQRNDRTGVERLEGLKVMGDLGHAVELAEIGEFHSTPTPPSIFHKNLKRVVFVRGEMAGRSPVEAVLALKSDLNENTELGNTELEWAGEGEWEVTIRVFRDLGLAFGAALIGIFVLLVIQTASFVMPLLIMSAIPLTAIGILPGFWLLNLLVDRPVGGYATPVFFTATAMIGMIALGGIVVRNAIVLIEFIQNSVADGVKLETAILDSGLVRMRPILLTAGTTAIGAIPITFDPIFSGLAWALIFGLVASTAFTLIVVPTAYYAMFRKKSVAAVR
ncbi:MAG: efflux RND transporter permease subunit [Planctomycetota bacterium]